MTTTTTTARSLRNARIAAVVFVLAMLAVAYRTGLLQQVGSPSAIARRLVEMGAWGYLAFVVSYTLLQPFGVPGTVFVIAAPLIWPWETAFVLSMVGTMGASVVGFSFARFVAKDWISKRIPARFSKWNDALEKNAFQTVVVLRLVLWMPQVLHAFFGVSNVRFSTHFWGSLIGYTPPLLLVSYLGSEMFDASGKMQPRAWPVMGALLVFSIIVAVGFRFYERRRLTRVDDDAPETK